MDVPEDFHVGKRQLSGGEDCYVRLHFGISFACIVWETPQIIRKHIGAELQGQEVVNVGEFEGNGFIGGRGQGRFRGQLHCFFSADGFDGHKAGFIDPGLVVIAVLAQACADAALRLAEGRIKSHEQVATKRHILVIGDTVVSVGRPEIVSDGGVIGEVIYIFRGAIKLKDDGTIFADLPFGTDEVGKGLSPGLLVKRVLIGPDGLIIIVVNRHPQFVLDLWRFSGDLAVNVNVAVDNLDAFLGQGNEALDVIYFGVEGIFEYDNIPSFRPDELIDALEDEDSVAVGDGHCLAAFVVVAAARATGDGKLNIA